MEVRKDYAQSWVSLKKDRNPMKQSWATGEYLWLKQC